MRNLLLLALPLCALAESVIPTLQKTQSVAVEGKLLCKGEPYPKARLKFYEVDPIHDTLMAEGLSDKDGLFKLSGKDEEWTTIDPKLNIYHNCEDESVECWRKIEIDIPDDFITVGDIPEKTFNIGILNLSAKYAGETRDCLN